MATNPKMERSPASACYTIIVRRGSPVGAKIDPALVRDLRAIVSRNPHADIQQVLGISSDTWTRIKQGSSVRPSTADRLIMRLQAIGEPR